MIPSDSLQNPMMVNNIPNMNMDTAETNCCPKFNQHPWENKEIILDNKLFLKAKTKSFLHIPLNMGGVFKNVCDDLVKFDASPKEHYFALSHDPSSWCAEHLFAVDKEVPGHEHIRLSGKFLTKVFEGPFKNMRTWHKELEEYVSSKDRTLKKIYFFYTTCPKCAKHWNKNYVIGFAEVE
jgi:hypothetical protein